MAWFDVEGFLGSLASRGVPAEHVALYREAAQVLLDGAPPGRFSARMVDDAVARAIEGGASDRRLGNLRTVGAAMVEHAGRGAATLGGPAPAPLPPLGLELEFLDERATMAGRPPRLEAPPPRGPLGPPLDVPIELPSTFETPAPRPARGAPLELPLDVAAPAPGAAPHVLEHAPRPAAAFAPVVDLGRPRPADAPVIDLARPLTPRVAPSASPLEQLARTDDGPPPLAGCACKRRRDVYLDDAWQGFGRFFVGFIGVAGLTLQAIGPPYAGTAISFMLLTIGAAVAAVTVGWRCEHCRKWIRRQAWTADQRQTARRRTLLFAGGALLAAIITSAAWSASRDAMG